MSDPAKEKWQDAIRGLDADALVDRMLGRIRSEVPGVPVDPATADPALRLLLTCLAVELQSIYREVSATRDAALHNFARRLLTQPRGRRPAETVVHFHASASGVEVGPGDVLVCTKPHVDPATHERVDITLEFRPKSAVILGEYHVAAVFRVSGNAGSSEGKAVLELSRRAKKDPLDPAREEWVTARPGNAFISFCVEPLGKSSVRSDTRVFLDGPREVVDRVLWGRAGGCWAPSAYAGTPPSLDTEEQPGPYDGRFVRLELDHGALSHRPPLFDELRRRLPESSAPRWWFTVELGGDVDQDISAIRFLTDCVPVDNRELHSRVDPVPGLPCQAFELDVRFDELVEVDEVTNQTLGQRYRRVDDVDEVDYPFTYFVREAPGEPANAAVYLRNPERAQHAQIAVRFFTSRGELGNGLGRGSLKALKKPKPGVGAVTNLVPTTGGRSAATLDHAVEARLRELRHHARAVTAQDFRDLAVEFGAPLIEDALVAPAVKVTPNGVVRCVEVQLVAGGKPGELASPTMREALCNYIQRALTLKAPVGTTVSVVLQGEPGVES